MLGERLGSYGYATMFFFTILVVNGGWKFFLSCLIANYCQSSSKSDKSFVRRSNIVCVCVCVCVKDKNVDMCALQGIGQWSSIFIYVKMGGLFTKHVLFCLKNQIFHFLWLFKEWCQI